MDIGQTFTFEGDEFAIKRIILPGGTDSNGNTYENGRVDASKFVGEGVARRIQKGRPKMFNYPTVATILGETTTPASVESDLTDEDEDNLSSWQGQRSDPEKVKNFMERFGHDKETVPTESDWA